MTTNDALNSYITALDAGRRVAFIRDISYFCGVSMTVVYNWRIGRSRIPALARGKITELIGVNIFVDVED